MLKEEYQPKAGDLIIFSSNGASHIGIVVRSDETTVYTIEGNTGNMVAQRSYPLMHEEITGYIVPDYNKDLEYEDNYIEKILTTLISVYM